LEEQMKKRERKEIKRATKENVGGGKGAKCVCRVEKKKNRRITKKKGRNTGNTT